MRKVSKKKREKEWERAMKHLTQSDREDVDWNGIPKAIIYDAETGRPLFRYRHPNLPLAISATSLVLVICKPVLLCMLRWLQKLLFQW